MQPFGTFVRGAREAQSINQTQLAERCNFSSNSTISRIEASKSSPTLTTAVRICEVLGLTPNYVLKEITEDEIAATELSQAFEESLEKLVHQPISSKEVLLSSDVEIFASGIAKNYQPTLGLLCALLTTTIRQVMDQTWGIMKPVYGGIEINRFPVYEPGCFENIIVPNPVIPLEIKYPEILPSVIYDIWKFDGVLIPQDVGNFIRSIRKDETINQLAGKIKIAPTTLAKIEQGQFSRITIENAIHLDISLAGGGVIFNMLWRAVNFMDVYGIPQKEFWYEYNFGKDRNAMFIEMLLVMARWWYSVPGRDNEWLNKFRAELRMISPSA